VKVRCELQKLLLLRVNIIESQYHEGISSRGIVDLGGVSFGGWARWDE